MKRRKNKKGAALEEAFGKRNINDPNRINTSVEIPTYAPNQGLRPMEYQLSAQLSEMEMRFKELCMDFLSKSKPDAFNSSYMDAVIERICVDAVKYVRVQRADHIQTIMKPLYDMHNGDLAKCKSKLEAYRKDKENNERELKRFKAVYYGGTSLAQEGGSI